MDCSKQKNLSYIFYYDEQGDYFKWDNKCFHCIWK